MGSAASKRDAGGGSGSSGSGRSLDSKRTLTKKQKKKQQSGALGAHESLWSSPFLFRQLYDEDADALILPGAAAPPHSFAPNATAVAAAYSAQRDQLNELFFAVATNTQWQQQQVRGLFAAYQEACLRTKDRVLNLAAFSDQFFPVSSHHHYPAAVIRKAYTLFDADEDGLISFLDFVQGVSRCVHGQRRHKVRLVFDLFDTDCDGHWSAEEAGAFLRTAMAYIKHLTQDAVEEVHWRDMLQDEQHDWWQMQLRQMQTHMEQNATATPAAATAATTHTRASATDAAAAATSIPVRSASSSSRESARTDVRISISFVAFRTWARTHLRVKPLLSSRFDVLPRARDEAARVAELWSANDSLRLGDTWYAVSEAWWRGWKAYSGFREPGEAEEDSATTTAAAGATAASSNGAISPPYLISDTDTDSDREELDRELERAAAAAGAAAVAAPSSAAGSASGSGVSTPATPQTHRKLSRTVHSPGAIQIGLASTSRGRGGAGDTTQAASAVASATTSRRNSTSAAGTAGVSLHMTPHGAAVAAAAAAASPAAAAGFPMQSPSPSNGAHGTQNGRSPPAPRPTAIDLSDLACRRNPLLLRQPLLEHEDFLLLHERVWAQLVRWYGLAGPHVFPRTVVEVGRDGARTKRVELYPLCLRVQRVGREAPKPLPAPGVPVEGACLLFPSPASTSVRQLEARMLQLFYPSPSPSSAGQGADTDKGKGKGGDKGSSFDLPPGDLRMWVRESNDWRCLLLEDMSKTLEALELQQGDTILVELEREPPDGGAGSSGKSKKKAAAAALAGPHRWHMDRRKLPRPFAHFEVGDQLDARDKQDVWYNAVIRRVVPAPAEAAAGTAAAAGSGSGSGSGSNGGSGSDPSAGSGSVVVSFVGWEEKWNEEIPAGSICACRGPCSCKGRLAPLDAQVRFKAPTASTAAVPSSTAAAAAAAGPGAFASGPPSPDAGHPSLTSPGQPVRGLCGLVNLGNTCFLASTLQCLSATPLLAGGSASSYFLSGRYLSELNKSNVLGHKGLVATEFGALLKELWGGHWRAVQPSRLKRVISDFAPQFDGYQQHDSHELLAFLLDGLHEDLNRVTKKVPTAPVESRGRPDAVVVRESWAQYKVRNQSVIVDTFMGMLKSTVVCPSPPPSSAAGRGGCGRVSITFDPFRYLTVPIPSVAERALIVTFCPPGAGPLVNYGLVLPEHSAVSLLKSRLSLLCGVAPHRLLVCEVHKSKLTRVLMDNKGLASVRDSDVLVAYQFGPDAFRAAETKPAETASSSTSMSTSTATAETPASTTAASSASVSSSSSNSSSSSSSSSQSQGSSSSRSSSPQSAPSAAATSAAPPSLRSDMVYLQAIHKYILTDPRTGHATMSPRFGIPVCLTTTPATSSRRVHRLLAQAIQRWLPPQPQPQQQQQQQADGARGGEAVSPSYTVRVVDHTCSRCGFCPESSNCGGCCLAEDDRPCGLDGGFALCVLWESEAVARQVKLAMDDSRIVDHASISAKPRDLSTHPVQLRECLELFAHREVLAKSDAWYCSSCKAHRTATKQLQVYHAPEILIVHLKRFLQVNRLRREKLGAFIDFPLRGLDLTPYIPHHALENQPTPVYDLYAVSNHSGGLSGGHYTSFCLHAETKRWYLFDDSRVTPVADPNSVRSSSAYCLFYKRRA